MTLPAIDGKSLLASKTALSLLAALATYFLPLFLTWAGIPVADQGQLIAAVSEAGPPVLIALGIVFRSMTTRPVTTVLPKSWQSGGLAAVIPVALALMITVPVLSACTTFPPASAASIELKADKALFIAESAYAGALVTVEAAVDSGALRGEDAAKAAVIVEKAYTALTAARAANTLGKSAVVAASSGDVAAILATLAPLLNR
jgi:hypothetical protein